MIKLTSETVGLLRLIQVGASESETKRNTLKRRRTEGA